MEQFPGAKVQHLQGFSAFRVLFKLNNANIPMKIEMIS